MLKYCVACEKEFETKSKRCPSCGDDLIEVQEVKEKEDEEDTAILNATRELLKKGFKK